MGSAFRILYLTSVCQEKIPLILTEIPTVLNFPSVRLFAPNPCLRKHVFPGFQEMHRFRKCREKTETQSLSQAFRYLDQHKLRGFAKIPTGKDRNCYVLHMF